MGLRMPKFIRALIGPDKTSKPLGKPKHIEGEGKADEIVRTKATYSQDKLQAQKQITTSFRSFHQGALLVVNLAQNIRVFYYQVSAPHAPHILTSPSTFNSLIPNVHLEAVKKWIQKLDPNHVQLIKMASEKRGILIEHLSSVYDERGRELAIAEYNIFHNSLKFRDGGFNTTEADQLKIAVGPNRNETTPFPIRFFKNSSHITDAIGVNQGLLAAPPSMMINLSFQTFYYISVRGGQFKDFPIDRVVNDHDKVIDQYRIKLRQLLSQFISSGEDAHQRLKKISDTQGAIIVALPFEANLRHEAVQILQEALHNSKISCSNIRTAFFYLQEMSLHE